MSTPEDSDRELSVPEPEDSSPEDEELRAVMIATRESHFGPIPSPWALREYEEILPGSADRILKMAEQRAEARHQVQSDRLRISAQLVDADREHTKRGMYLGGALGGGLLVVAVVLALEGATWPAVVAAISQLVPTLAVFIPNARARWRNRQKR